MEEIRLKKLSNEALRANANESKAVAGPVRFDLFLSLSIESGGKWATRLATTTASSRKIRRISLFKDPNAPDKSARAT